MQKTKTKKKAVTKKKAPKRSPAKRKKLGLGKGLNALIPEIESIDNNSETEFFHCDINLITPNRYQPRLNFSKDELEDLSGSIKEQGVLQPLLVRKNKTGYELIAGERRLRASKMAGLDKVPVIIKDISDTELLELSIVENIQRENLNAIEEADAYQRLIDEFDFTQEQVATRVGKSRSAVANFLRLRQLNDPIKLNIVDGTLSMGHARALLGAESASQQEAVWKEIISKGLSVRQAESLIKKLKSQKNKPKKPAFSTDENYFKSITEDLSRRFGTKVQIKRKGRKGKVEIEFYGNEDLGRLIDLLKQ
ncbi:MAG: ParB/RepB/Spo0J family partition protein [Desulfobacteraceae bacterium]|nr:ParB/RepB/Spo0J family partition protein [Desulfobacteraceae bacterium]